MSAKRVNRRKGKLNEDINTERQSSRKSNRINKSSLETDNHNSNIISTPVISSPKVSNLSQYFPQKKRSCSSPRNSKYTQIKSPKIRSNKRIFSEENPIIYGEFDAEDEDNQRFENSVPLSKDSHNNHNKCCKESVIKTDFMKLLSTFKSIKDEVIEDMNQNKQQINYNDTETDCVFTETLNNINDSDSRFDSMLSSIVCNETNINPTIDNNRDNMKTVSNNEEEFHLEDDPSFDEMIAEMDTKNLENTEMNGLGEKKMDNCDELDFDDSFEQMLSEMNFVAENSVEVKRVDNFLEDDGFESDDSFELMVSEIKNDHLLDESKKVGHSRVNSSTNSNKSLLTLSEIIQLLNDN